MSATTATMSSTMDMPRSNPPIDFPSTDPNFLAPTERPPYLPFRRISLPSAPSLLHRHSVVSVASFDSLPEEGPVPIMTRNAVRKPRPKPLEPNGRRGSRSRPVRPVDETRSVKRLKVIHEFYDTEKAYVDGLQLIYSLFLSPIIASLDTQHPLLDRTELTAVFSNFIDIWNFHRSFFSSLSSLLSQEPIPPLSPILLSHFPYLSLYNPFITSFPEAMSSLNGLLSTNVPFASFVAKQEADGRCGKLKLRDWLLTIVQRCPRYLLLLKDLIGYTDAMDSEHAQLTTAHALVSKITSSLNTSLHSHAQTLALLALQRATPNLPFQLISPGRMFLKRGPLLQLEHSSAPREREFLLFSDRLIWLASADKGDSEPDARWGWGGAQRPGLARSRSKSEAELPVLKERAREKMKVRHASTATEDRWVYKGSAALVDLDVVISPDERRLEVLSPETSFVVYSESQEERDEWGNAIRGAKASLMTSLNAMRPNSTLTSSVSTQHLRRSLQALPHAPRDEHRKPKRGRVEHFVPAIWIPDGKTESCMRCGRAFGWRRRRHHCRLCGRCVCASCSGRTFFISDPTSKDSSKPARCCDACYDTVFPLLEQSPVDIAPSQSNSTLSSLPAWLSLRSSASTKPQPEALMAIDMANPRSPKRALHRIEDETSEDDPNMGTSIEFPASRIRPRSAIRPRSYHQILEDFEDHASGSTSLSASVPTSVSISAGTSQFTAQTDLASSLQSQDSRPPPIVIVGSDTSGEHGKDSETVLGSPPPSPRKEDTARRHKRFSVPAVALQTTPVTTRPDSAGEGRSKRFSLVLGGGRVANQREGKGDSLGSGVAAGKLSELLGRKKG